MTLPFQKQKTTSIIDGDDADTAFAEQSRSNDIIGAFTHWPLGGSLHVGISGTGPQDIPDGIDVRVDAGQEGVANGTVLIARVEGYTLDAGVSVTPEIWDVTTLGSEVLLIAGSPITSTTKVRQAITLPAHPASVKFYRLRANKSSATAYVCLTGTLERSVP